MCCPASLTLVVVGVSGAWASFHVCRRVAALPTDVSWRIGRANPKQAVCKYLPTHDTTEIFPTLSQVVNIHSTDRHFPNLLEQIVVASCQKQFLEDQERSLALGTRALCKMARLNEPPVSTDSLETRKFIARDLCCPL